MNPKLFDFAKQSKLVPDDCDNGTSPLFDALENYAQLVVADCANAVSHIRVWDTDLGTFLKERYKEK